MSFNVFYTSGGGIFVQEIEDDDVITFNFKEVEVLPTEVSEVKAAVATSKSD